MDLGVNFMGLNLKNPIIVAAGPLTANSKMMKKAIDAGAGAVVTKTIANEIRPNPRPRLTVNSFGMQNIELYSDFSLEDWAEEIYMAKEYGATVIANIMAHTPSEMAYIASRVEKFGADAIELGVSSPNGEGIEVISSNPKNIYEMTKMVVDRVKIPVMIKMSAHVANLAKLAKAAEDAGAAGISGIDTIRGILGVDIHRQKPLLPTYGGYSGDGIRPIGLASVATICQAVNIPVSGIGGITDYNHVLEYMMLGATTVQMCTGLVLNGVDQIQRILEGLHHWMDVNNVRHIDEIRGSALKHLKSYEEIKIEPYFAKVVGNCTDSSCNKCIKACTYDGIQRIDGKLTIDMEKCTGCGICEKLCENGYLSLEWAE